MRIQVQETLSGTTLRVTWVSSGTTVSSIYSTLLDKAETVVNTATPTSSGGGLWYAIHPIPNSNGWYVNEWQAIINANTYVNRQYIKATKPEVD